MSKTLQRLIAFSVITLSGLLALISVQRSLCTRSSTVEMIEDSSGHIYLFSCQSLKVRSLAPGHPGQMDLPRRLKRSVEKLEWLSHLLRWPSRPLRVTMTDEEPFAFHITPHGVVLGSIWVGHEPSFLRAMIHAWLVNVYPELGGEPLSLGVWTLYFLAHLQGRYQIEAWDGQVLREDDVTHSRMAVTLKEYCLSPFKPLQHFDVCAGLHKGPWADNHVSLWPLMHLRALKLYHERSSLADLQAQVMRLSRGDHQVMVDEEDLTLDVTFVLREEALSPEIRAHLRALDDPVLVESDSRKYWLSKWGEVDVTKTSIKGSVRQRKWVRLWMSCEAPQWGRLMRHQDGDWLWIPICSSEMDVPRLLTDLHRRGLRQAFVGDRSLPFVWINGKGLGLIERLGFDLRKSAKKKFDLIRARQFAFWQNDAWDADFSAFRPRSAIPLVRWHRANQNILGIN